MCPSAELAQVGTPVNSALGQILVTEKYQKRPSLISMSTKRRTK